MEGSVAAAGQAQGDAGEAAADAQGAQQQQEQGGIDVDGLQSQLEAVASGQEQLRELLAAQHEAGEGEDAVDPMADLSWLDVDSPEFDPQTVATRLSEAIEQSADQRIAPALQRVEALEQAIAEQQRAVEAERLLQEFPEMGEREVAQSVVTTARQLAEMNGRPDLANEPWFWRLTYMAGRAADAANAEAGQDPQAAMLESGQGARPGAGMSADELGAQITTARRGRGVLPFG